MPRVSIGLPVYNGEKFLAEAIESILDQTFEDLELIISDNASTDRTEIICQEYAKKDPRVIYRRNEKNLGAAKNFNQIVHLASGEYFKWVAADEGIEPDFLEKAVEVLDKDKSIVNVCARYIQYNEMENTVQYRSDSDAGNHNAMSEKTPVRFRQFFTQMGGNLPIFGLIRTETLKRTKLIRPFIGSDDCLVIELLLMGKFLQLPDYLIRLRDHPDAYHYIKMKNDHKEGVAEASWFDPENKQKRYMPFWRRFWEYYLVVIRSDALFLDKISMIAYILYFFGVKRFRYLGSELIFSMGLGPSYIRLKRHIKRTVSSMFSVNKSSGKCS